MILGVDVKAGSKITLKGEPFAETYFYLLDGPNKNAKNKKLILENGTNELLLKDKSEVVVDLPEEAVGKYVMIEVVNGGPNQGRFQIVDVE